VPSEKRARQRAAREQRLAAQAKAQKRRKLYRNVIVVVVVFAVIVGIAFLVSNTGKPSKSASSTTTTVPPTANGKAQLAANKIAIKAGCPANTAARVNTQQYKAPPAMTINTNDLYSATVVTTDGTFTMALYAKAAPALVNSFVFLADKGYFHCVIFHRVIPGFVDQTGDPTGAGTGGPGYTLPSQNVPKAYATGDVAEATSGEGVSGSQFFLVVPGGATTLDGDLASGGYPLWGDVISGLNVVEAINEQGSTSGSPPEVTQRIISVTIHQAAGS
jgi:cyclophilin family peptidyl-prolyl cis-trans isomerase